MPKTPPRGVHMSSEERDLRAMKERREELPPIHESFEETTSPMHLIEAERERYESDLAFRQEIDALNTRYNYDPAFRALWKQIRNQRRESNRTLGKVADATTEVHHDIHRLVELGEKLEDIAKWKSEVDLMLKLTKWILGIVFTMTLGSVIVIATKIYTWGVSSGEIEIRIQHVEKALERRYNNSRRDALDPAHNIDEVKK